MRVLAYEWSNYLAQALRDICDEFNIKRDSFTWEFHETGEEIENEEFTTFFENNFAGIDYDFVISINYRPVLATLCNRHGMKYVAWCCDCPLSISDQDPTLNLETNYIFLFDYMQTERYKNLGVDRVYHLPLGANSAAVKRFRYLPNVAMGYKADVSFVGRLYESQYNLITQLLDTQAKAVLDEIIANQEELYNYNLIGECVSDELISYMNDCYTKRLEGTGQHFEVNKPAVSFALASEVTRRNRLMLLGLLAGHFDTKLYSTQIFPDIAKIVQKGPVMYETEMPYVFHCSKININPSLRCIETGVPLRAFDIMGYGGFLLSNYQEELALMYKDGEELVLYDSYADAVAKAEFYLKNDALREKICEKGRRKTLEEYTLQKAFLKILKVVDGDN